MISLRWPIKGKPGEFSRRHAAVLPESEFTLCGRPVQEEATVGTFDSTTCTACRMRLPFKAEVERLDKEAAK